MHIRQSRGRITHATSGPRLRRATGGPASERPREGEELADLQRRSERLAQGVLLAALGEVTSWPSASAARLIMREDAVQAARDTLDISQAIARTPTLAGRAYLVGVQQSRCASALISFFAPDGLGHTAG